MNYCDNVLDFDFQLIEITKGSKFDSKEDIFAIFRGQYHAKSN